MCDWVFDLYIHTMSTQQTNTCLKSATETLEKDVKSVENELTSFWCLYLIWTYFTPFSSVSLVDLEQVIVS